ncbi:hypothetical protein OAE77_00115 [bacterium]|nr:hypothetical protein [bacterium]
MQAQRTHQARLKKAQASSITRSPFLPDANRSASLLTRDYTTFRSRRVPQALFISFAKVVAFSHYTDMNGFTAFFQKSLPEILA